MVLKSKNPNANAGVFSVSDGGPGRNRQGPVDSPQGVHVLFI